MDSSSSIKWTTESPTFPSSKMSSERLRRRWFNPYLQLRPIGIKLMDDDDDQYAGNDDDDDC